MSRETWEIIQKMEPEDIELQLAVQCAPLITGLKASNLLNISKTGICRLKEILRDSGISLYLLKKEGDKITALLYDKERLETYFQEGEVKELLFATGYKDVSLRAVLLEFRLRYRTYMESRGHFPHEIGLLLGYPAEDVEGFIKHRGKNYLCTGYWKVYANQAGKSETFKRFEYARESLVQLLSWGMKMEEIIDICRCCSGKKAAEWECAG